MRGTGRAGSLIRAAVARAAAVPGSLTTRSRGDLLALAAALQALAEVTDARAEICAIVARTMRAERVVLFEPEGDGITSTASSPSTPGTHHYRWGDTSSSVEAFRTGRRVTITGLGRRGDDAVHRRALRQHLKDLGITSAITQPVTRGGEVVAVLSIQFRARDGHVSQEQGIMLEALAAGAASAAGRVDLLARLADSAGTDPLTGLGNRRTWQQRVDAAITAARRDPQPLTIAMIDIDHFKLFNDRCGHLAGDQLLTEVARCLTATVRGSDVVARWGGEEFAILMSACDLHSAAITAGRIMRNFPGLVTCSIGLAQRADGEDGQSWLGRADTALLRAKAAGRARVYAAGTASEPAAPTEVAVE